MSKINVKIDCRETGLHSLLSASQIDVDQSNKKISKNNFTITSEALPIGDIILELFNEITQKMEEIIIIERKSVQDLEASIKDGRYTEQSFRLNNLDIPNHNIVYLIEGPIFSKPNKSMLYSAMFSLNFTKGFSVLRSMSIQETAFIICNMVYKIQKNIEAGEIYNKPVKSISQHINIKNVSEEENEEKEICINPSESYCSVSKKIKKDNITPENISEIMLCQIPGISSTSAIAIMKQYKTISNLLSCIKSDPTCLKDITYTNNKNQTRKINKTIIVNITKFLL